MNFVGSVLSELVVASRIGLEDVQFSDELYLPSCTVRDEISPLAPSTWKFATIHIFILFSFWLLSRWNYIWDFEIQ